MKIQNSFFKVTCSGVSGYAFEELVKHKKRRVYGIKGGAAMNSTEPFLYKTTNSSKPKNFNKRLNAFDAKRHGGSADKTL